MANPSKTRQPDIFRSEQSALNRSYDDDFEVIATEQLEYDGTNLLRKSTPFLRKPYDSIVITYTDSSKATISTVVTKLGGVTQETLTLSQDSTTDTWTRS